jgi:4-hydroxybenzoate polyprenyltransferase
VNPIKLWRLSRPRFWIYVFGPYIVGLVAAAPSPQHLLSPLVIAFGVLFLFPANILIYGVNDVFDYETDIRNVKKEKYEALLHPHERPTLWKIVALTNLPFLLLLPWTSTRCVWAMCGFLFFSLFYSAPPIRAKARPILDSAFNVLYVFPGVFAYFLAGGNNFQLPLFVAAWFWAMAMHAYSAVPDISADRDANIPTVATFLGFYGTLLFCTALYAASALVAFRVLGRLAPLLGLVYIVLMWLSLRSEGEDEVRRIYKWFPLVNTVVGFVLFWAVAIGRFFNH